VKSAPAEAGAPAKKAAKRAPAKRTS
jgi:hypothetical protein